MAFTVGNWHKLVKNPNRSRDGEHLNKHCWTAFVELTENPNQTYKYVKKVRFHLCEGFGKDYVDVSEPDFELTYRGWGTFHFDIDIEFKNGLKTTVSHYLSFDGKGAWK